MTMIAARMAATHEVPVLDTPEEIERAHAASVAVPSALHHEVTTRCLNMELDVLIEKPLAPTIDESRALVDAARGADAVLQVGHVERFNPAIQTLADLLLKQELVAVETHRLGPFSEHLVDEDVVFDLMIHDIDIVEYLVDGALDRTTAVGSSVHSEEVDHVLAQMAFDDDVVAAMTASHVTHNKVRTLNVTTNEAYIKLDYQSQDVQIFRAWTQDVAPLLETGGYRTEVVRESPYVSTREPLKNELEHFAECVRTRETPEVSGEDGLRAVRRAREILDLVR
jgi:predicted dehydrogenase